MLGTQHLILQELTLHPTVEWTPPPEGWSVARIADGVGYWLQDGLARELKSGDCWVANDDAAFVIRASSLGSLRLEWFFVYPPFLVGLLTVAEVHQLELAARHEDTRFFLFGAQDPVSQKFARLVAQSQRNSLPARSALLQLWTQGIAGALAAPLAAKNGRKLRERFRELVAQMPDAELAARSLPELAGQLSCSQRQFSRLFHECFGASLRKCQTELRLQRARQLLEDSNARIFTIARESGFQHLGLFNAMFKRRFGVTPSEWRQKALASPSEPPATRAATPDVARARGVNEISSAAVGPQTKPPVSPAPGQYAATDAKSQLRLADLPGSCNNEVFKK